MVFVQLDRTFRDVSSEDDVHGMAAFTRELYYGPTTWERLLQNRVIVVLAEARAGKSEECRQLAREHNEDGKTALFIPLRALAQHGLPGCLRGTEEERGFGEWLQAEDEALFLLDSVDECRIAGQALRDALQNLMQAVRGHENRVRVVITSRIVDWRWEEDPTIVQDLLASVISQTGNDGDEQQVDSFRMVAMQPLTLEKVKLFCTENGLRNPNEFLNAIEEQNAGDLASRPMDLQALISLWNQHGRIGSLKDILEEILWRGLEEENPEHRRGDPLSPSDAMDAAKLLGAALTMTKKAALLLPDAPEEIRHRDDVLVPREVLQEMDSRHISSLLDRRLFFEAGTGRVRLHRDIQDFLTAKWLRDLLSSNGIRKDAENLIFRSRYRVRFVAPTLDAACAWAAGWDQRIRKRVLKVEPDNLIRQGDPVSLSMADRQAAIDNFIKKHRKQPDTGVSFDINALKKFPVADFAGHIGHLLHRYRDHEDIRSLLLRLIWARKVGARVDDLFPFLQPDAYDMYTHRLVVRAIGEAGTTEQQEKLANRILLYGSDYDEEVLGDAIRYLFPSAMSAEQLTELLENFSGPSARISHGLKRALEELCQADECVPLGLDLLEHLVALVRRQPYWEKHRWAPEISEEFQWLCPAIGQLVNTLVKSSRQNLEDYSSFLEALDIVMVSERSGVWQYTGLRKPDIQAGLDKRPKIKRAHFWFQRAKGRNDWDRYRLCPDDASWLFEDVHIGETDEDKIAAFRGLLPFSNEPAAVPLDDLKAMTEDFPILKTTLDDWLTPPKVDEEAERMKRERDARRAAEDTEHQKWMEFIQAHTTELADVVTDWEHRLGHVIEQANSDHSSLAIADWRIIEEHFGWEVAEAVRDGCRKYWRNVSPLLDAESGADKTLYAIHHAGISGVNFERLEPDWPRHLSLQEAEIAARYALIDLNGPAEWLDEIHAAYPDVVAPLLVKQIDADWVTPAEKEHCHTLVQRLRYGTPRSAESVCPYMLERLEREIPRNHWIRRAVVNHLMSWPALDEARLAAIARREFEKAGTLDDGVYWMAVWLNVNAMPALERLERHLKQLPEADRFMLNLCNVMNTGGRDRIYRENPSYMTLDALRRFLPIVYRHVRREEDREHRGTFTPDARDDAERFRGQLLEALYKIRSRKAYKLILKLSKRQEFASSRERFRALARQKAATDGDHHSWSIDEFLNFPKKFANASHEIWHAPISLAPSFAGVGLDLKKAWRHWGRPLLKKLHRRR